ncbi:MAG: DsbA family oxidoreductase [Acidimicrobiales bacterium]
MTTSDGVVEVFADVGCPFTHVGLRRFVERRDAAGRQDIGLRVRAWPLEVVNGQPLDPRFIAEEVDEVRTQVAPTLFTGFTESTFPSTSLPALAVAAAGYRAGLAVGEQVSLALRDLLFERGEDISDPDVLARFAADHGIQTGDDDLAAVRADHAEGIRRGVIGSPHFFTPAGGFFCPALDVSRDDRGHLRILADPDGFESFISSCFA